jgi:hypothetical protein
MHTYTTYIHTYTHDAAAGTLREITFRFALLFSCVFPCSGSRAVPGFTFQEAREHF